MAINERLIDTEVAAAGNGGGAGTGNQEEGLILHLDASDVDSYDGDGSEWVDITNHEYKPTTDVSEHFNTVTYTGDSAATNDISGVGFQPDLVWIKNRSAAGGHWITDSIRGAGKALMSQSNGAEITSLPELMSSFDSDGFTVGYSANNTTNYTGYNYVAWCFKAGGAAVSNTDGDITSSVSVNTDLGFSIATYTATGTSGDTFGHGLGVKPDMAIVKETSASGNNWHVYVNGVTTDTKDLRLNSTNGLTTVSSSRFAHADVDSSVIALGGSSGTNTNGSDYVAYCFASKRGVSKVGSYKGTGAAGNKIYTGFEPAFVMVKRTDAAQSWGIYDNKRVGTSETPQLLANVANAEAEEPLYFERDGFRLDGSETIFNGSGGTYIYYAVAKSTNVADLTPSTDGEEIEIDLGFDPSNVNYTDSNYSFNQDNTQWNGNADTSSGTHEGEVFMNNYFKSGETGKYYYEIETIKSTHGLIGFTDPTKYTGGDGLNGTVSKTSWRYNYFYGISFGNKYTSNGSSSYSSFSTGLNTVGQVTAVAIDVASRKVWMGTVSSGSITWFNSGNPDNGTNPFFTLPTGWGSYHPLVADGSYSSGSARYGWFKLLRDSTATTLPTGFTQLKGAIKNASLELHLDADSFDGSTNTPSTWTALTGSNGTISGATFDSELGNYLDFDGSNDYISIPSTSSTPVDFSAKNYTIEAWIKPNTASAYADPILSKYGATDSLRSINFNYASNGKLRLFERATGTDVSHDSTSTLTLNRWTHVAVTRTSSQVKLYIDGSLDNTISSTFTPNNGGSQNINIGSQANGQYSFFDGQIGQVRIYSSALTQDQIRQNFNFTKPNYPNGFDGTITGATFHPDGYFDFDGSTNDVAIKTIDMFHNDFTLSMWWKLDSVSGYQMLFGLQGYGNSSQSGFGHYINGSTIHTWAQIPSSSVEIGQSGNILSTGVWHHIVLVREGSTWKHYLDGDLESTYTNKTTIAMNSQNGKIGEHYNNSGYNTDGKCSKVKVYDRALSDSEITDLYNEGE